MRRYREDMGLLPATHLSAVPGFADRCVGALPQPPRRWYISAAAEGTPFDAGERADGAQVTTSR